MSLSLPDPLSLTLSFPLFTPLLPPMPMPMPLISSLSSSDSPSASSSHLPSASSSHLPSASPTPSATHVSSSASTTPRPSTQVPGVGGTGSTVTELETTTSSMPPSPNAATSHDTAAIAGGVAGGFILLLIFFALALLFLSRRKKSVSNVSDLLFIESGAVSSESLVGGAGHMHFPPLVTPFHGAFTTFPFTFLHSFLAPKGQMSGVDSAHCVCYLSSCIASTFGLRSRYMQLSRKGEFELAAIPPRFGKQMISRLHFTSHAPSLT
jgi:hypothetical protein